MAILLDRFSSSSNVNVDYGISPEYRSTVEQLETIVSKIFQSLNYTNSDRNNDVSCEFLYLKFEGDLNETSEFRVVFNGGIIFEKNKYQEPITNAWSGGFSLQTSGGGDLGETTANNILKKIHDISDRSECGFAFRQTEVSTGENCTIESWTPSVEIFTTYGPNRVITTDESTDLSDITVQFKIYQSQAGVYTNVFQHFPSSLNRNPGEHELTFSLIDYSFTASATYKYFMVEVGKLTIQPSSIGSEVNPIIVTSSGYTFQNTIYGYYDGESVSVTVNRNITYEEAASAGGAVVKGVNYSKSYQPDSSYESRTITETANLTIYCDIAKPISLRIVGEDENSYQLGVRNRFKKPKGLTYYLVYNDGGEELLSSSANFRYRESQYGSDLSTLSYLNNNTRQIVVVYTKTISSTSFTVFGYYDLNFTEDRVVRLEITAAPNFVLGNRLTANNMTVKATYLGGGVVDDYKDYTIVSPTGIITNASQLSSVVLETYGYTETISHQFTTSIPDVSEIKMSANLVTAYNNGRSRIDLTGVTATVYYENAEYTETLTLALQPSSTSYGVVAKKYNASSQLENIFETESLNNYNGSTVINIEDLTMGSASCAFVVTVLNRFDSSVTETENFGFNVLAMSTITGIKIKQPFTDYRVGDTFLNENDDTILVIYWEEEGALMHESVPLKGGYESIAIYPEQGTTFKNVDSSKQILVKSVFDSNINAEYTIQVLPRNVLSNTRIHDLVVVWKESLVLPNRTTLRPQKGLLAIYDVNDTIVTNGIRTLANPAARCYGYIDNIYDEYVNAKVVLFDDFLPEIDGSANIEVTFPCYTPGEADIINHCKFGCLFGANNSVNRLFVSGNEDIANADWHTHQLNLTDYEGDIEVENGNFSYIPAESVMYYGETDNKVVGYEIIANDKLLVLKDKSDKEKTIYFRVPITVKSIDAAGSVSTDIEGNVLYQEEFGLVKGNNSVAGISPNTILNFNGDTLFIDSDNQLSGLDLIGIVGDNQRYATSRSKLIDFKLKDMDLSKSSLWTNNKYLFLSVPNVGLFVTHFEAKADTQYEWWYMCSRKLIPNSYGQKEYINSLSYPTVFIEIDNKIYFGNETGNFGKLFNGQQNDIKKLFAGKEQTLLLAFDPTNEVILCDSTIIDEMEDSVNYRFEAIVDESDYQKNIYYRIATLRQSGTSDFRIDSTHNTLVRLNGEIDVFENHEYFLNYIEEDLPTLGGRRMDCAADSVFVGFGGKYRLIRVDAEDSNYNEDYDSYYLEKFIDGEYQRVQVSGLYNASLCERLSNEVDVIELNKEEDTFALSVDNKKLNLVIYGLQDPNTRQVKAEIKEYIPIEAFFITAPMLASNLNVFKTIWQISMTNDTEIPSSLQVGIASNKVPFVDTKTIAEVQRGDLGINFNDMNFNKADFEKKVVPRTYTVSKVLGMQKFICFAFKNEKGNNAVLSEMAVTYTLPFPSYGSD